MIIISNNLDFVLNEPTVLAIGKFDGDHIGHQKLFSTMREIKANEGLAIAAFTFAFSNSQLITSVEEKRKRLENEGVDYLIEYPFNDSIKEINAKVFLTDVLLSKLKMKHIVAGTDCSFGHNREGNVEFLHRFSKELNYDVTIIDKVKYNDTEISSTLIRELINEGFVEKVNTLIGSPYQLSGIVEVGNRKGASELGFPTVNIMNAEHKAFPKRGVYYSHVILPNGCIYKGITNIGTNPSISDDKFNHIERCETHIIDYSGDLYNQRITIQFIKRLRDEIVFNSLQSLKDQLSIDLNSVRNLD